MVLSQMENLDHKARHSTRKKIIEQKKLIITIVFDLEILLVIVDRVMNRFPLISYNWFNRVVFLIIYFFKFVISSHLKMAVVNH